MPNILSTGLSGMLAFQRAIEMTGHNIANANTPGYSRQVAEFVARDGQNMGNGYVGGGTEVTTIKRIYDRMMGEQLLTSTTGQSRFSVLDSLASRVDNLLADPDTALNSGLQGFFNSMQDLANDPASIPARRVMLGEAEGVAQRFIALDGRLGEMDDGVNSRIKESVANVNQLATAIADVNEQITFAQGGTGQPPNDLLDRRDLLLRRLSEQVSVTTATQDDGSINVFIGSGQPLVAGAEAYKLGVRGGEFDPTRAEVVYEGTSGPAALNSGLTGGALGGLQDFRAQILDPARGSLDETALALAARFNEQHASGMDLTGEMGAQFFGISDPTVLHSSSNTGAGTAVVAIDDVAALTGTEYVLEYDGADYALHNAATGASIAMTGSGSGADPFIAGGIRVTVGGAPAAGDRISIHPAGGAAGSVRTLVNEPRAVAMASPVRVQSSVANFGDAHTGSVEVTDRDDPDLLSTVVIEFTSADTYSIDGAGALSYTSGDTIDINGVSFDISGTPAAGDQFVVEPNLGASGDNSNGLLLADIQTVGILDGGTVSINENYGQLVAAVGGSTHQIKSNLEAQNVILANAEDAQLSVSGVNLDEEAANLIRYQQAYQAAAQMITVANSLFDSLLAATRR
ncbi:MAG: flagellar hook-associated protein FlgK [Woeseia sp.]